MDILQKVNAVFVSAARRGRAARPKAKLYGLLKAHSRVEDVEVEQTDGWFITLRSGWKSANDPLLPVHCFGAGTLTEAMREVRAALPCDCAQCRAELETRRT